MLLYRVITAIVAIPLLTAAIVWGGDAVFLLLVLGFGGTGLYEFMRAALPADRGAQKALGIVLGLFILCCVFAESRPQPAQFGNGSCLVLAGCIISFVALFVYSVLSAREADRHGEPDVCHPVRHFLREPVFFLPAAAVRRRRRASADHVSALRYLGGRRCGLFCRDLERQASALPAHQSEEDH